MVVVLLDGHRALGANEPPSSLDLTDRVTLGCLAPPGSEGCHDPQALALLAYECRRRTSIATELAPVAVPPSEAALYAQPLLIWQGSGPSAPLTAAAADRLAGWLLAGGLLLCDSADPPGSASRAAFFAAVEQSLAPRLASAAAPVPAEHVLYRSFYLLRGLGTERPLVRAMTLGGRLAVVFADEPWLASVRLEADRSPSYPGLGLDEAAREQVLRLAINWLMYALCLDYKDDQVHLPFLLERRR